jgi:hypothetical protein
MPILHKDSNSPEYALWIISLLFVASIPYVAWDSCGSVVGWANSIPVLSQSDVVCPKEVVAYRVALPETHP